MYTLYTDKSELFEATISVSGASLTDTLCRLIIESDFISLIFTGKIDRAGCCEIPIRALAKFLPEGSTGMMKLEVIAENTYFVPWESEFSVKTGKKVTAEVKTSNASPVLVEARGVTTKIHEQNIVNLISGGKNLTEVKSSLASYLTNNTIDKSDNANIRARIKTELKKAFTISTKIAKRR